MKSINFSMFSFEKYRLSNVSVIRQKNSWTNLCHPSGRACNGFIFIISGECCYKWGSHREQLSAGSIIYLPKGSHHSVFAREKTLDFYRLNFTLTDIETSEETIFSEEALPISNSAPQGLYEICEALCRTTLHPETSFKTMAMLCEFIDYCVGALNRKSLKGIDAAINFIKENYTKNICINELADMCFISHSHLFRLFKERLGMSPVDYKNSLRIKKAEAMVCDPECSIQEIADILGFENACYFTRIFKKQIGVSPLEYRKSKLKAMQNA